MILTMRTILVLLIGAVVAFLLFIVADLSLGTGMGPMGMNPNFSAVIGAWRALGGGVDVGSGRATGGMRGDSPSPFGMAEGASPFAGGGFGGGRRGHHSAGFGEGIDLERALGQAGSDLVWLGIPALIGAAIELNAWNGRRRRRRTVPRPKPRRA